MSTTWKRALITGASAGIGASFAHILAARQTHLVLVARDTARLEDLAARLRASHGVEVEVLSADLSDATALRAVAERLTAGPTIDLLVNNAGISTFGAFAATDLDAELRTIAVNVSAPVVLTKAALETMTAHGGGAVITISSMDGLTPAPYHSIYGGTKAFVNSFFEAVHEETRRGPVTVTTVLPGYVDTDFTTTAGLEDALKDVPAWMILSPEKVAQDSLSGAAAGKAVVIPGAQYKISAAALNVAPTRLTRRVFARLAPRH